MAYQKEALLNWDPIDQTVLANEQVDAEGRSWRSGAKVESKLMKQWFFRIGDFASSLVDDLELLRQGWPEQVIRMQENWIGRSEGSFLDFELVCPIPSSSLSTKEATKEDDEHKLRIFTTRMDTAFGATYVVVAPEHPLVKARIQQLLSSEGDEKNKQKGLELEKFVAEVMEARRAQRFEVGKSKNGMTLDIEVKHPFKKDIHLPIYVGDYVVMDYGTGAVMGVPAHDSRDWEFAHKHNLPIRPVISPSDASSDSSSSLPFEGEGTLINSFNAEWNGLTSQQAKRQLTEWATRNGVGGTRVQYKLRDWLISRQRYWGAPIPIVYCENEGNGEGKGGCGAVPVPEEELPVVLPTGDEVKITGRGGSPLGQMEQWVHTRCPKCGGPARRETDTMDTFVDSSWYFLRYPDAHNSKRVFDGAKTNQWMPVDVYIGGIEHAILHLLYSRFITKFLHSRGYIQHKEPFPNLLTQGMVTGQTFKDPHSGEFIKKEYVVQKGDKYFDTRTGTELKVSWEKMSKSKYNGIDPNQILSEYGADTARLFVLFKAPPPAELEWDPSAIAGQHRWLHRVWNLVNAALNDSNMEEKEGEQTEQNEKEVLRVVHETIKKVTQDLEAPSFSFNTAVAELMKLSNAIGTLSPRSPIYSLALRSLCLLMAPFAPHISSEMWSALSSPSYSSSSSSSSSLSFDEEATREWAGNISSSSVFSQRWPKWKEEYLQKDEVTVAIQVQGKTRGTIQVPRKWIERVENGDEDGEEERRKEEIERMARESEVGKRYLNAERGVEVVKVIVPSGRPLINFVVRENKKKKKEQ
ncbi:Leucine--tRNA ligase, variant 2 [Balamuthia mandrillaris]